MDSNLILVNNKEEFLIFLNQLYIHFLIHLPHIIINRVTELIHII